LETEARGVDLGKVATGFVIQRDSRAYLISNGHVFSGRNPRTLTSTHCPDAVRFKFWHLGTEPKLVDVHEPLLLDSQPLWLEHPILGDKADVVALPLTAANADQIPSYDPWRPRYVEIGVGDDVTVVGFPFGANVERLAIWTRASIASEYDADYEGLPVFLVDARTRNGQSGSPVIFFKTGAYFTKRGALAMPQMDAPRPPGAAIDENEPPARATAEEFLGVYSGRIDSESDLGCVWRPSVIREIIEGGRVAKW
jgi:hypothetical protein